MIYHEKHLRTTLLLRIHKIRDRQQREENLWAARGNYPAMHLSHFPITRPEAKRLCDLAGVSRPRPGKAIILGYEENVDASWTLVNHSGSFQLECSY